ncbi:MAG: DUF488 domain-containing protein [Bryobacterales bacterium]|nr:DUF488 domain-containing protein [Bryobacteraceae bacterium]MDW8129896.1 DUF488 domain-containing protein [Bryobacterales bacterium]
MQSGHQQELFDAPPAGPRIYSIGHSTRKLEELIAVLKHYGIRCLVDIRHFPASRHNPQFNREELERALPAAGIEYRWLVELGGYRSGGYLVHMLTPEFAAGLAELERLARERPTAFMCAEIKWFQCHRRRVADALAERGWQVVHIFTEKRADTHRPKTNRIRCEPPAR